MGFPVLVDTVFVATQYVGEIKNYLKGIYMEVCAKYKVSRLCIERNLRTLIKIWKARSKFDTLFENAPTNAKLVIGLAHRCVEEAELEKTHSIPSVYDILFS